MSKAKDSHHLPKTYPGWRRKVLRVRALVWLALAVAAVAAARRFLLSKSTPPLPGPPPPGPPPPGPPPPAPPVAGA